MCRMFAAATIAAAAILCMEGTALAAEPFASFAGVTTGQSPEIDGLFQSFSPKALLRTWFRTQDAWSFWALDNAIATLPGSKFTLTCPAGQKCTIEMDISIQWGVQSAGIVAGGVKVDGTNMNTWGAVPTHLGGQYETTHWTYVKNVGAGKHTVEATAFDNSVQGVGPYAFAVRLYRR
jgi:hypothetical protein